MPEIAVQGLAKRFGTTQAIANFSLTVGDGEFVVLLGPTGAGKTTLLRLVAGLERPDEGRILIDGADVTALQPSQRNVTETARAISSFVLESTAPAFMAAVFNSA